MKELQSPPTRWVFDSMVDGPADEACQVFMLRQQLSKVWVSTGWKIGLIVGLVGVVEGSEVEL